MGLATLFKSRGHEIIFAQRIDLKPLIDGHGFQFKALDESLFTQVPEFVNDMTRLMTHIFQQDPVERWRSMTDEDIELFGKSMEGVYEWEDALTACLKETFDDIDLVIVDCMAPIPFLYKSDKPYVSLFSPNPIGLYEVNIPMGAGFGLEDIGTEKFKVYRDSMFKAFQSTGDRKKQQLIDEGLPELADKYDFQNNNFFGEIKYCAVYHYPEDLDYHEIGPIRDKFFRIESFIRKSTSTFEIPENLKDKPGQLIYFSLGSLACMDLKVMQRLIDCMSKSPHRFIVSTGPSGDQLKLYDNMWGDKYVDQIAILQKVDFAIIHGGNNSFMETLFYGKPMIVIPYFFDQIDNAKRAEEKGIGKRIFIWDFDEDKFLQTIEEVANNQEMREKVAKISHKMQNSKQNNDHVLDTIEKMVWDCKNKNI